MSQAGIISVSASSGVVDSITVIAPITATGVSGVAQTGNVSVGISGGGLTWVAEAVGTTLVNGFGYINTNATAAPQTFPLPAVAAVGDQYGIMGAGIDAAQRWTVSVGAGQNLSLVDMTGTVSAVSNEEFTTASILCTVANTNFVIIDVEGSVTLT